MSSSDHDVSFDLPPPLLTLDDVADLFRKSTKTIRRMVYRGELKAIRLSGTLRFDPREVRRLLLASGWDDVT